MILCPSILFLDKDIGNMQSTPEYLRKRQLYSDPLPKLTRKSWIAILLCTTFYLCLLCTAIILSFILRLTLSGGAISAVAWLSDGSLSRLWPFLVADETREISCIFSRLLNASCSIRGCLSNVSTEDASQRIYATRRSIQGILDAIGRRSFQIDKLCKESQQTLVTYKIEETYTLFHFRNNLFGILDLFYRYGVVIRGEARCKFNLLVL